MNAVAHASAPDRPIDAAERDRPDPAMLDAAGVDAEFAILRDRRETLMLALRGYELRARDAATPDALLDAMEARVGLAAVFDRWRQLLARILALETWPPLGSASPAFADVTGDERHRSARALVPLTPDSLLFVHGPVTLWHAAALAERMLASGDRLIRLARGAFHRELTVEPRVVVWDTAFGDAPTRYDAGAVAVEGAFATAAGRTLAFVALAEGGPVPTRRAGWHPVAAAIIAARPPKTEQPETFAFRFDADRLPVAPSARSSDILLAKAEALVGVFTQHFAVGERVLLLSRVLDLAIERDLAIWLAGRPAIAFDIDWTRQRAIPGRGAFVPMRYRITPEDAAWRRSLFVCLDSHLDF